MSDAKPRQPGIRRSLAVTTMNRYAALAISFVSTLLIARLLTPVEIGIFSMAAVFLSLAHSMRDFGVGRYIIQEQELTTERLRTAFGITLAIAWCTAAVLWLLAPWLAVFFGERGVGEILRVLAINFTLIPFGSVVLSYINREMQFEKLFRISITSDFLRAATAVALAWLGFGYMSLAWGALVGVSSTVILARLLGPRGFVVRPGFREWRRVLRFGGQVTVATVAYDLQRGAPDVVIGRFMDAAAVGFFGKALGVVRLFYFAIAGAVTPAILPHMAARHRAGESLTEFYAHGLGLLTALAWPFYAFVAVMAMPIVRLLYGDQWDAAVPLARILTMYASVNVLYTFAGQALIAVGMVHLLVRLRLMTLAATVAALLVAVPHGLETAAFAMVVPAAVGLGYSYWLLRTAIGLGLGPYVRAAGRSLVITAASAALPVFYLWATSGAEPPQWQSFLIGAVGAGAGWLLGVVVTRHPILGELRLLASNARNRTRPANG